MADASEGRAKRVGVVLVVLVALVLSVLALIDADFSLLPTFPAEALPTMRSQPRPPASTSEDLLQSWPDTELGSRDGSGATVGTTVASGVVGADDPVTDSTAQASQSGSADAGSGVGHTSSDESGSSSGAGSSSSSDPASGSAASAAADGSLSGPSGDGGSDTSSGGGDSGGSKSGPVAKAKDSGADRPGFPPKWPDLSDLPEGVGRCGPSEDAAKLGSTVRGGGRVVGTGVCTPPPNRRPGGWVVDPAPPTTEYDISRSRYIPYPKAKIVIVTGASENHARSAACLARSVRRLYPNNETHPFIIYDLGVSADSLRKLRDLDKVEVRSFEYAKYPKWWDINVERGHYGWKPEVYNDVLRESLVTTMWVDAGSLLRQKLDDLIRFVSKYGMYVPSSPGDMSQWTHPGAVTFMSKLPPGGPIRQDAAAFVFNKKAKTCASGLDAFSPFGRYAREIAGPWRACAYERECFAPIGSSRLNHRQDQTALGLLINWKYPGYWAKKSQLKRPVRFQQDKKPCKLGDGAFTYVPPQYPDRRRLATSLRAGHRDGDGSDARDYEGDTDAV